MLLSDVVPEPRAYRTHHEEVERAYADEVHGDEERMAYGCIGETRDWSDDAEGNGDDELPRSVHKQI